VASRKSDNTAADVNALIQEVLRESYKETTEDLRFYAEKVRYFNQCKKAIRDYLAALRDYKARIVSGARERGVSLCSDDEKDLAEIAKLIRQNSRAYKVGELEHALCIPNRVPTADADSLEKVEAEIKRWEERLNSLGDDAQLANVDLQNILQKQQQTLQMMSNISKMLHDTAMSVIRKIGG